MSAEMRRSMFKLVTDIVFSDGETCIDIRKKLRTDFTKNDDFPSCIEFEKKLESVTLLLLEYLPSVMMEKLRSAVEQCVCRISIRAMHDDNETNVDWNENQLPENGKYPVLESGTISNPTISNVELVALYSDPQLISPACDFVDSTSPQLLPCSDSCAEDCGRGEIEDYARKYPIVQCEDDSCEMLLEEEEDPLKCLKIERRINTGDEVVFPVKGFEWRLLLSEEKEEEGDKVFKLNFGHPHHQGRPPALRDKRYHKDSGHRKNLIGHGQFGQIFKTRDHDTGTILAVKEILLMSGESLEDHDEINIMERLDHNHIVKLLGYEVINNNVHIYLEWMAGGSVEDLLVNYGSFNNEVILNYGYQILLALDYLHGNGVVHCDIKGANILVDSTGQLVRLCDFGLATYCPTTEKEFKLRGTYNFMACELFNGGAYTPRSDIWSFGCTLIQMATAEPPDWGKCDNEYALIWQICTSSLAIPSSLPDILQTVIKRCLEKDVHVRPSAADLLLLLQQTIN